MKSSASPRGWSHRERAAGSPCLPVFSPDPRWLAMDLTPWWSAPLHPCPISASAHPDRSRMGGGSAETELGVVRDSISTRSVLGRHARAQGDVVG